MQHRMQDEVLENVKIVINKTWEISLQEQRQFPARENWPSPDDIIKTISNMNFNNLWEENNSKQE